MPRDTKSGKFVLESVKRAQVAAQAERTARAVAWYTEAPDAVDLTRESSSSATVSDCVSERPVSLPIDPSRVPSPLDRSIDPNNENGPWDRHIFGGGRLVVFSRGSDEAITIRKNPDGFGWFIDFEERSSTRQSTLPE
jgi:hypothetical protein